jgi:hypothetical protein
VAKTNESKGSAGSMDFAGAISSNDERNSFEAFSRGFGYAETETGFRLWSALLQ